jgi:lysophospholipase L1-like esterase
MRSPRRYGLALVALALGLGSGGAAARRASHLPVCPRQHWVGTWTASPSDADAAVDASLDPFTGGPGQTLRMIVTPHLGGRVVRVHLSNRFGSGPVTFSAVTIAHRASGPALVPGTTAPVRFGGSPSVTVPAGQDVVSDPVRFAFRAFDNLAVSVYLAGYPGLPTEHFTGRQTSYYTLPGFGDHSGDPAATAFVRHTTARYYLDGLDVLAAGDVGSIVAFGDSITDGYQGANGTTVPETASTLDTNGRWPDDLQRRLIAAGDGRLSVVNQGISGNRVTANGQIPMFGPSGLSRFRQDALEQPGVTEVIVLEGINDIGQSSSTTAAQIEAGYEQMIAAAHRAGVAIVLGTLTPSGTATGAEAGYASAGATQIRGEVNTWIRDGAGGAAGYIDFDAAVRDPANPNDIRPAYDGGDGLHFNLAGYQAMADAVRLSHLLAPRCRASKPARIR